MERHQRSLILATWREQRNKRRHAFAGESAARYSMFVTPQDGMQNLIDAIAARLPSGTVRKNAQVSKVSRTATRQWKVSLDDETLTADSVVLALPAPAAGKLLSPLDAILADELSHIPYAGCAVVSLGYRREQIAHPLDGFGFVVPMVEKRRILSASFSSVKFTGRAPDGHVLIRVFLGGACQRDVFDLPDNQIATIAHEELAALLTIRGEPVLQSMTRWAGAMPQYHVGHLERVARISQRLKAQPGLALAGNAYHGVGVPQCVQSGEQAAEEAVRHR
jgi:oxygen-dependent protoporphyrinogen oxidase